jgi:hypothetical protein
MQTELSTQKRRAKAAPQGDIEVGDRVSFKGSVLRLLPGEDRPLLIMIDASGIRRDMPEGYRSARPYPGKTYTLAKAAKDGHLVLVRCNLCRRLVRYLASDLATVLDPRRDALDPPYPCSKCGRLDYVKVKLHLPVSGDYGHLIVRRPAGVKTTQMWKSVKLGD